MIEFRFSVPWMNDETKKNYHTRVKQSIFIRTINYKIIIFLLTIFSSKVSKTKSTARFADKRKCKILSRLSHAYRNVICIFQNK